MKEEETSLEFYQPKVPIAMKSTFNIKNRSNDTFTNVFMKMKSLSDNQTSNLLLWSIILKIRVQIQKQLANSQMQMQRVPSKKIHPKTMEK